MWNFSLNKVVVLLTPYAHRKEKFTTWLRVSVSYLEEMLVRLRVYWQETIDDAMMTPQIKYLEHFLNTKYDRDPADIFIDDGYQLGPWIWPVGSPADPIFYLDQADSYVYCGTDEIDVDFVVNIPEVLTEDAPPIGAIVTKYKLPGKHFVIQTF